MPTTRIPQYIDPLPPPQFIERPLPQAEVGTPAPYAELPATGWSDMPLLTLGLALCAAGIVIMARRKRLAVR